MVEALTAPNNSVYCNTLLCFNLLVFAITKQRQPIEDQYQLSLLKVSGYNIKIISLQEK